MEHLEDDHTEVTDEDINKTVLAQHYKKRNGILKTIFFVIIVFAIPLFLYWFLYIRFHTSTKDAYVEGNVVMLMAPIQGIIVAINFDDNDFVKEGEVILKLDPTIYQLAYDTAMVELALSVREVKQLEENIKQRKAELSLRQAELLKAKQDMDNKQSSGNTQIILSVAQASVLVAEDRLHGALAALGSSALEAHPTIEKAKVTLKEAYTNLYRCHIFAPTSGYIAQRTIQVGEFVTTSSVLLSIIPLNEVWVTANFKETQLENVRIGQKATMQSDFYGSGVIFNGIVQGIGAGTGSQFALIPPQNASGNWIKIVQRIPVRLTFDDEEVRKHPLLLGLSMNVSVNIEDQSGSRLAMQPPPGVKYQTSVFQVPMEPINVIIMKIIAQNLNTSPSEDNGS